MAKITVYCAGIVCENRFEFEISDWIGVADYEEKQVFCPVCKLQAEWFDVVCPGCVGIYPDCGLGKSFAYSDQPTTITDVELGVVESGRCPYRTNGSIVVERGAVSEFDLSELAPAGGQAIRAAIEEHLENFPR